MLYDLQLILDTIHMTHDEFKQVCILAGTDYSRKKKTKSFYYYYQLFKRFKKSKRTNFYKWIHNHQITTDSIENLEKNIQMFDVSIINIPPISKFTPPNQPEIQKLLEEQNFIFPPCI
jgi:predicted ATPase